MIHYLLSAIVFLPLIGALLIIACPRDQAFLQKYVALAIGLLTFGLSCIFVAHFDSTVSGIQFLENYSWIASHNISYLIGVDGVSAAFVPLTALLFLLGILSSMDSKKDRFTGMKGYFALFLILETCILGTFTAQDLFLFFAFWVSSLLPIYFIIGVWGGKNREYASTKFFLYQLAGSGLLLLGMLVIYYVREPHTFNLLEISGGKFSDLRIELGERSLSVENLTFFLMLVGFALRLPIFPFHSWFPSAQAESPTALSVILASVFLETAAYGIIRINYGLFPKAAQMVAPVLAVAGVINLIYGGICALGQKDIRRLIAFFCISSMGLILLGFGSFSFTAFHGAILHLLTYGIAVGLLFFLVGILGKRSGAFSITNDDGKPVFGGLVSRAPVLTGFFTVGLFSALGAPGFGGFASELLVFLGAFSFHRFLTLISLLAVFLTAGYLLWMYRRVFLGPAGEQADAITDLTVREQVFLVPLVLLCLVTGFYPAPLIHLSQSTLGQVLSSLTGTR